MESYVPRAAPFLSACMHLCRAAVILLVTTSTSAGAKAALLPLWCAFLAFSWSIAECWDKIRHGCLNPRTKDAQSSAAVIVYFLLATSQRLPPLTSCAAEICHCDGTDNLFFAHETGSQKRITLESNQECIAEENGPSSQNEGPGSPKGDEKGTVTKARAVAMESEGVDQADLRRSASRLGRGRAKDATKKTVCRDGCSAIPKMGGWNPSAARKPRIRRV